MSFHHETSRCHLLQITGALMHVENPRASAALKMVVMAMVRRLEPRRLPRKLNGLDGSSVCKHFQITVNGRQTHGWHDTLRSFQDLNGQQGSR